MSGEQTFGAWLLEQQQRQDTTGALARAWQRLKEARGYNRHTRVKSIKELMSSSLGEDWLALRGDEAMDTAEAEWKAAGSEQPMADYAVDAARSYAGQQLPTPNMGGLVQGINYMAQARNVPGEAVFEAPPMAVLTVDGHRYELTPGRHYVLVLQPVLREAPDDGEQPGGIELTGEPRLTVWARPDGGYDWAALYGLADHSAEVAE